MRERLSPQQAALAAVPRAPSSGGTQRLADRNGADFAQVPLARRLDVGKPEEAVLGGGAESLQEGPRDDADDVAPQKAPAASCAEAITWVPRSPVPIDIRADDALEFAAQMDQAMGSVGHTQISIGINSTVEEGKVKRVGLTVESSIIRPRWAGGRPSDSDRKLIKRVETFVKKHEERHRDLSRSVMQQAVCDALSQPVARAEAILDKAVCDKEPMAQEALDATEGKIEWVKNSSGAVVDFKLTGVEANYHVDGCKLSGDAPAQAQPDAERGEP